MRLWWGLRVRKRRSDADGGAPVSKIIKGESSLLFRFRPDREKSPMAVQGIWTNKNYATSVQELEKKNPQEPGKAKGKHGFGSPFLHQYSSVIQSAETFFSELQQSPQKVKELTVAQIEEKVKALKMEQQRLAKLTPKQAEQGIRLCRTAEAHQESEMVKVWLKIDHVVAVEESDFYMQDILLETMRLQHGNLRTTPAPPGALERKLRDMKNKRGAQRARRK